MRKVHNHHKTEGRGELTPCGPLYSYVLANVITLLLYTIGEVPLQEEEEEENGKGIGKENNSFELLGELTLASISKPTYYN